MWLRGSGSVRNCYKLHFILDCPSIVTHSYIVTTLPHTCSIYNISCKLINWLNQGQNMNIICQVVKAIKVNVNNYLFCVKTFANIKFHTKWLEAICQVNGAGYNNTVPRCEWEWVHPGGWEWPGQCHVPQAEGDRVPVRHAEWQLQCGPSPVWGVHWHPPPVSGAAAGAGRAGQPAVPGDNTQHTQSLTQNTEYI